MVNDTMYTTKGHSVQTFIPTKDFETSASVMDLRRLGKQIIEGQQIYKALTFDNYGWQSHPAVKMWRGHRASLVSYVSAFANEWRQRRSKDHGAWLNLYAMISDDHFENSEYDLPGWWGTDAIHLSHQSKLVSKMPEHYRFYFPDVPDNLDYVWPVK